MKPLLFFLSNQAQRNPIWLVNCPSLTSTLKSLAHHWAVAWLSLFCQYIFGLCSSEYDETFALSVSHSRLLRTRGSYLPFSHSCYCVSYFFLPVCISPGTSKSETPPGIYPFPFIYNLSVFKRRVSKHPLMRMFLHFLPFDHGVRTFYCV